MQKFYINTVTGTWYNSDGDLFRDGMPEYTYQNSYRIAIQLCSSTPSSATEGVNPEEWEKYTGYSAGGVTALLSADNDFRRRRKGTVVGEIPAGAVSQIAMDIESASSATIRSSGTLRLFNTSGVAEVLKYDSVSISGETVTFSISSGSVLENSYSDGAAGDVPDAIYAQAAMIAEESDPENGLFVFDFVIYSEKLREKFEYADLETLDDLKGIELLIFSLDGDTADIHDRYFCKSCSIKAPMAEPGLLTEIPDSCSGNLASMITALISNGFDVEFSADGDSWHMEQLEEDSSMRFRLKVVGESGEWIVIQLKSGPAGTDGESFSVDQVDSIENRPDSAEDGFCFVASDEGKIYWFIHGNWTDGAPFLSIPGPEGQQGPEGPQGPVGPEGPQGKSGDGLVIDATGTLADRHDYDAADRGFRYLATDLYCEAITAQLGNRIFSKCASEDGNNFAWSDGKNKVYTNVVSPEVLAIIYDDKDCKNPVDIVINTSQKFQLFYQKITSDLGDWSDGIRMYCGAQGEQGPQGEPGKTGEQGPPGENVYIVPHLEFGTESDESLEIIANSVEFDGVKPIATVEIFFDDPDDPGEVKTLAITHLVTINYCDSDNKTHVYFTDKTIDLSHGGRIRFAQGVSGATQYQEYLANGGTLDYNSWLNATLDDAPNDGNFYCRRNGKWVAVAVIPLDEVSLSGTKEYHENISVGEQFSLTFDVVSSNGEDVAISLTEGSIPYGLTLSDNKLYGTPVSAGVSVMVFTAQVNDVTMLITVSMVISEAQSMYYGYVLSSSEIYKVSQLTEESLSEATVSSGQISGGAVTIDAPAGAVVFALVPAGFTVSKDDGLGGRVPFELDNGAAGTGANGQELTINGTEYLAFGEFNLIAGETIIYIDREA